jgi:hypothetical protein
VTPTEPCDRLSEDDQAALRDQQFRELALRVHSQAVAVAASPGKCANCMARCLPLAVYCDDACRTDHEDRLQAERRRGRRL